MKIPRRRLSGSAFLLRLVLGLVPIGGLAASLDTPDTPSPSMELRRSGEAGLDGPPGQPVRLLIREVTGPGDSMVRLHGENLSRVEMVLFNGLSAVFRTLSDQEILAWLPNGLVNGPIQLRSGTEWITADPTLDLNIPGGILLSIPPVPGGSPSPVFTNAATASDAVHWVLDNDGALWVKTGQSASNPSFLPLQRTAELDAMKWIAITPEIQPPNDRWVTLRKDGVLVARNGAVVKHDRPIVSFAVGGPGIAALDVDGAVWNLPWPDADSQQPVRVAGFGDPPPGIRQVVALRSNRGYHYALNRAGQLYRWAHTSSAAQRMTDQAGIPADWDLVDWVPQDRQSSGLGFGITQDGKLRVPDRFAPILGDIATDSSLTPEGFQQYFVGETGRSYFLTRSGLAVAGEPVRIGLNSVGDFQGSVARIYSGFLLARPRPNLGRGLPPLLSESGVQAIQIQARGHGPLVCEWLRNGMPIEGETNAKLSPTIFGAALNQIRNGDVISVRVSNEFGSTTAVQPPEIGDAPILLSAQPNTAPPGAWIILTGNNFSQATSVWIGNQSTAFRVLDDNHIEARVPKGNMKDGVRVYTHQLKSATTAKFTPITDGSTLMVWPVANDKGAHREAPTERTDILGTFAGFGCSGALHKNGSLEVWGTQVSHQFLPETTAIASLRNLPVYMTLRAGSLVQISNKDGLTDKTFAPPVLFGVSRVTGARAAFIALLNNNQVVVWPKSSSLKVPADVQGRTVFTDVTAGESFAAALLQDGTVRTWGESQGAVPVVPNNLPRITKIRATRSVLYALDVQGNVWGLMDPASESAGSQALRALPWTFRDCVDIETGADGLVALRRDGRWVTWDLNPSNTPANLEAIEPSAFFSIGNEHGLGLFQRSIYINNRNPAQPLLAVQGTPFTIKVDVTASPYHQSYWVLNRDGINTIMAEGETLSLPAMTPETQGQYTLITRNPFGVERQTKFTVVAIEKPSLVVQGLSSENSAALLQVTSPYIANFPFNPGIDPRWRFESAPSPEGPWAPVAIERLFLQDGVARVHCKPSEAAMGFFRIEYDGTIAP